MTLRVLWPNVLPAPDLRDDVTLLPYDCDAPLPEPVHDADVFVVWARPAALHADDARVLTRVRLVQGLMAGTNDLVAAGFTPGAAICSGVGLHDRTVSEHVLALVLSLVRHVPQCLTAQADHRWPAEYAGPQPLHPDGPVTTLLDARVLIWGFGSIAATLAPILAAMGADVTGVARTAGDRHGFPVVAVDDVDAALADTDVLVSLLPGTPETDGIIDADRIAALPDHAYLVNAGRGSVLDEDALVAALHEGRLAGAALDVMRVEPLPADSPLWDAPNVVLTPHCAGGRPVGYDALVAANLDALRAGGPLRNRV